jgi:hypothetical protein
MKCPHCRRDLTVVISGPLDHPMVPGLAHVVSSCCDTYLSSVTAPMPKGTVTPFKTRLPDAEPFSKDSLPKAA